MFCDSLKLILSLLFSVYFVSMDSYVMEKGDLDCKEEMAQEENRDVEMGI